VTGAGGTPLVIVVMGIAGSGKSTVGRRLAERLGWDFLDADDLHPPHNVAKMAAGQPLTDEDRLPWLAAVAQWIAQRLADRRPAVVACSALKRVYRERIRAAGVGFVYLAVAGTLAEARVASRPAHFMPSALVASQVEDLEPPAPDEGALELEADEAPDLLVDRVVQRLHLA
jgi:gluconokinase/shikimate kinase